MSSHDIKVVKKYAPATRVMFGNSLDEVVRAAERYEFVRTLKPHELMDICHKNLIGLGCFDDLVDEAMKARQV